MNEDKYCHLCGQKSQIRLLAPKSPSFCDWCEGEHVVIGGYNLGWMYQGEKDALNKIPFSKGVLWFLDWMSSSQQKAKENQMDKKLISLKFHEQTIALWGATHAGKSWLFDAFIQRMLKYNSAKLRQNGAKFSFFSIDPNNVEREIEIGEVRMSEGTQDSLERAFIFRREDTIKGEQMAVNAHCHTIRLFDDNGKKFVGKSAGVAEKSAQNAVANSNFIMIALDNSSDTAEDLADGLRNLQDSIRDKEKKHIAVCFTKADLFPDLFNNENHPNNEAFVMKLIEKRFDHHHGTVLELLENLRADGHHLKYFAVSSCGFLQSGQPNFDLPTGKLIKQNFIPVNVELPFLWLFQIIEKARLEPDLGTLYPYLSDLKQTKRKNGGAAIKKQRLKKYKTYEDLLGIYLPKSRKAEEIL